MLFGRLRRNELLDDQKEFLQNCLVQIEDLESRVSEAKLTGLRDAYADVWVDSQDVRELPDKVKLARRFATDVGSTLQKTNVGLKSVWPALETLQGIIDHCEHGMQTLLATLATLRNAHAPLSPQATVAGNQRPRFGKRQPVAEPKRPSVAPAGRIFDQELFQGERGELLRQIGYAPDDPRNQAVNGQPLSVLLTEDLAGMRRATEALNGAAPYAIEPWHLLPREIWRGELGVWLRQSLDLSPCRPWNTIFLPSDEAGEKALGLPVAPPQTGMVADETMAMLHLIRDAYAGSDRQEGKALGALLAAVRSNTAELFPRDIGDFSDRVRAARADVRALAFLTAVRGGGIERDAILKSQQTFLADPRQQLVS